MGADVKSIDFSQTDVCLDSGEIVHGDVIVAADGMFNLLICPIYAKHV